MGLEFVTERDGVRRVKYSHTEPNMLTYLYYDNRKYWYTGMTVFFYGILSSDFFNTAHITIVTTTFFDFVQCLE